MPEIITHTRRTGDTSEIAVPSFAGSPLVFRAQRMLIPFLVVAVVAVALGIIKS